MTPQVSVVVMAHPKRAEFVTELLGQLDRPAGVVWDAGDNDRWNTGRRAMLAHDPHATHHLVVQDDAIVCRDLVAGVEQALGHVPEKSPLGLYVGRVRPYRELIQQLVDSAAPDTSWLTMSQLHWGVGVVMPTELIEDMIAWCDLRTDVPNYDQRMSRWLQHQMITVWYPWPSLVDHHESPSLVPGRGSEGRCAYRFLGAGASALEQRWDGRVVGIPSAAELANAQWRVVGHCAHATVATLSGGRGRQLFFRGATLPETTTVDDLRHLWSLGLIEPVPEPTSQEAEHAI